MLHGVYPEILHFVQEDEGFNMTPHSKSLSGGERIISTPDLALRETPGRVRECNEVEKKKTIFSLEE